jgi:tetratricopeptide (TPR) repeat protein
MKMFFLLCLTVALTGCFSTDPSKDVDGALSYGMGLQAEQHGNLTEAREYFAKAMKNAHSGRLGPAKEAYASYGWARTSGYLGLYADAEKGFENTLALIDKSEGDANSLRAPVLFELARLFHDIGEHAKAVKAYAKAFAELERGGVERIDPLAYAGFLDDDAESQKAVGNLTSAAELTQRAAKIREQYKGAPPRVSVRRYKD